MPAPDGLDDLLRGLWERTRPRTEARIAVLAEAAAALRGGTLDDDLREQARAEAHRLAGSLGTMGLDDGSPIAKALELLLETPPGPDDAVVMEDGVRELRALAERGPA